MELYEESEHAISSDEYSDDDDDNDDDDDSLRNFAVASSFRPKEKDSPRRNEQKQKQLSSLIRRNKISIIYKNKSIKWLNNKNRRERYKGHITRNRPTNNKANEKIICENDSKLETNPIEKNVINLEDDDDDDEDVMDTDAVKITLMEENSKVKPEPISLLFPTTENKTDVLPDKNCSATRKPSQETKIQSFEHPEKRARSCSLSETEKGDLENNEKKFKADSPQFYKKINQIYPAFDSVVNNHIEHITNSSVSSTEDKMKSISNEIQTLNEILHAKELEWNRILHLKMVKEEILSRLSRKKHVLEIHDSFTKVREQNSLSELKDLHDYLLEKNSLPPQITSSYSSIQIIESRANMKTEDLERERTNTSRLHSLLVSRNMLPTVEKTANKLCENGEQNVKSTDVLFNDGLDSIQQRQNRMQMRGRPGGFKDDGHYFHSVENYNKPKVKGNFEVSSPNKSYPYCQECKIHESRFVCAGCGNQWYCSKKCQITAWDRHSEICTD